MKRLITDKQLREKLGGCSNMMIWRLRRDGKLPMPKKLGNRNVTPEDEADKAIQRLLPCEVGTRSSIGSRDSNASQ